jgi:predicted tellurium resistance membrane protein TerC
MNIADSIVPLITLIVLEVILGIDNVIFISILSDRLPPEKRDKLRKIGLALAMILRLGLVTLISWVMKLEDSLFKIDRFDISGKDLILIAGGIFLMYKSTKEIFYKTESDDEAFVDVKKATFKSLLFQILLLDLVFSLDSIITAVGMVNELWIMYVAIVITVVIMLFASKPISTFINKHPSFKVLALCFLITIGVSLVAEGLDFTIKKQYIYFSMAFSFMVNLLQMFTARRAKTKRDKAKSAL